MTVTITTKQDFIDFLTSCISVDKQNPKVGEDVTITIQSDETLVAGDGVSDLSSIVIYFTLYGTGWSDQRGTVRRNTTAIDNWTSNNNTSIDVGGLTAGSLNELLNHGFSFTSSFTGAGTIDPWIQIETTMIDVSEGATYNSAFYINQSFPVTLVVKTIIATATSGVSSGKSSTNNLTYINPWTKEDLVPGETYSIHGTYLENGKYMEDDDFAELKIRKLLTNISTTPISSTYIGESTAFSITLTVNNDNIEDGNYNISLYDEKPDGTTETHSYNITTITGVAYISYTFSTAGNHNVYILFPEQGKYNSSRTDTFTVEVKKLDTQIIMDNNSFDSHIGETIQITGKLSDSTGIEGITNASVKLVDYDNTTIQTTTTDTNGKFAFNYTPQNSNVDGKNISVVYEGSNIYMSCVATSTIIILEYEVVLIQNSNIKSDVTISENGLPGDVHIIWGDGTEEDVTATTSVTHNYLDSGVYTIRIQGPIKALTTNCFDGCSGLTSVIIPSSVTGLGYGCFRGCSGLTSVTIPSSVTLIGVECFRGCSGLTSVTIPSSVTNLGNSCFRDCSGLTSVTIPSSVTKLGSYCFRDCSNLTNINMKWNYSGKIIQYNNNWVSDTTMFNVPSGTKSLYVEKGYPSDRIIDPAEA